MRSNRTLFAAALALGLLGFMAACSNPPVVGSSIGAMTWWDTFIRTIIRDSFIGYTVPIVLAVAGFFLSVGRLRWIILGFSVIYLGFVLGLTVSAFGLIPTALLNITREAGIKQYGYLYSILLFAIFAGIAGGRLFCGWVCPMGGIQQFLFRKNIGIKVNRRLHNVLRWVRFGVLAVMVVTVVAWGATWWGPNDPFRNLFRQDFTIAGVILMGGTLLSSIFFFAPWCRYACPLGAFLALTSKLAVWKVKIDESKCTNCQRCWKVDCDYQAISPGLNEARPKVNHLECTSCGECLGKCPEAALKKTWFRTKTSAGAVKVPPDIAAGSGPAPSA